MEKKIENLSNLCSCHGLIMKTSENQFTPIKLAVNPYKMKKSLYEQIGLIHQVWQKLIYLASKDDSIIQKTFQNVAKTDKMINNLYKIYQKTKLNKQNNSLMFTRVDFFKNTHNQSKIIEYNLTSVSMASHSQNFSSINKLVDLSSGRNLEYSYPKNTPATDISEAVKQFYEKKNHKGLFLMVVGSREKNVLDQTYLQFKLFQKGINSKRQSLEGLCGNLQLRDRKLYLKGQLISMVYYRTGYQPNDYCKKGDCQQCWKVREIIELSQAIKIPNIKMELMNQKRMQVELSKDFVHQKYLTAQQSLLLKKSLVFTADFEQNLENINPLQYIEEKGKFNFILKPNLQGGGNNIYGEQAYELLKKLSEEQKKNYILMEKIITEPIQNIVFSGKNYQQINCICEVSRYGIFAQLNGKILRNSCDGNLVRVKPENQNEGGVMAGVGAICTLVTQQ